LQKSPNQVLDLILVFTNRPMRNKITKENYDELNTYFDKDFILDIIEKWNGKPISDPGSFPDNTFDNNIEVAHLQYVFWHYREIKND
jgi:hypothetical protein